MKLFLFRVCFSLLVIYLTLRLFLWNNKLHFVRVGKVQMVLGVLPA